MALIIEKLSKKFESSHKMVLEGIDLEIKDGEFVCILGASGCGKSTLLNLIAGLDVPTSGKILHNGGAVRGPGPQRGYIFQESALFPWLNVRENVRYGLRIAGFSREEQEKRVDRYLDMVKLRDYADYRVHELSGGMKQRVSLARMLSIDSDMLLMDEPFAALDSHTKDEMRAHLIDIWKQTGRTILFVTHSLREAFSLADRVIVLSADPARIIKEYRPHRAMDEGMMEEARSLLSSGGTALAS